MDHSPFMSAAPKKRARSSHSIFSLPHEHMLFRGTFSKRHSHFQAVPCVHAELPPSFEKAQLLLDGCIFEIGNVCPSSHGVDSKYIGHPRSVTACHNTRRPSWQSKTQKTDPIAVTTLKILHTLWATDEKVVLLIPYALAVMWLMFISQRQCQES